MSEFHIKERFWWLLVLVPIGIYILVGAYICVDHELDKSGKSTVENIR